MFIRDRLGAAQERAILCIEEFYPVFDSAGAKIVKAELERTGKGWAASRRKTVAEVPYVHRIAQLTEEDGNFIAAGKLCKHKDCSDAVSYTHLDVYKRQSM